MSATPQDVQAKLDIALNEFIHITSVPSRLAAKYGNDPTKWPSGHAHNFGDAITQARKEAGMLVVPKLTAAFIAK